MREHPGHLLQLLLAGIFDVTVVLLILPVEFGHLLFAVRAVPDVPGLVAGDLLWSWVGTQFARREESQVLFARGRNDQGLSVVLQDR